MKYNLEKGEVVVEDEEGQYYSWSPRDLEMGGVVELEEQWLDWRTSEVQWWDWRTSGWMTLWSGNSVLGSTQKSRKMLILDYFNVSLFNISLFKM